MRTIEDTIKDYEAVGCLIINLCNAGRITPEQKGILMESILLSIELARQPLIYNLMMTKVSENLDRIIKQLAC